VAAVVTQRVLIVGGASGIGAACAEVLNHHGAEVVVVDLREPSTDVPLTRFAAADVRDADALTAAVDAVAVVGGFSGVVYAAGIGSIAPIQALTPKQWRLVLGVNLDGAFFTAHAALPHMTDGAAFVFISSVDSSAPVSGLAHYCASKAGVDALSRSLALELGPRRIRSNVVAPGPVRTPLMNGLFSDPATESAFLERTPLGAIAEPRQIADTVAFLLSPAAAHVTGARLPVDGGMSLREHPSMLTAGKRTT
jgi:NAD(P)-dependent dehydrogenase (short-subunit alcohol dehydrogenase family)